MHVIATAGHVDHGKSTLVRALTGIEPDRWEAERRRGLTIDLGYAWTTLPGAGQVAFVDVPGHRRFIGNMLTGLGPAPAVLVVVAADAGWSAQSEEHLRAIDALGLTHGLLVVTRADLADPAMAARVGAAARERISASSLGEVDSVIVSAVSGQGLDDVRDALGRLCATLPAPVRDGRVRLWVDRAFTIPGSGTVVTGTLGAGTIAVGDVLEVAGRSETRRRVTVRGLQSLERSREAVTAVARVAVNLRGVAAGEVHRGDALLTPEGWRSTANVDVRTAGPVADLPREVLCHIGTAAVAVRVRPLSAGAARLSFERPLPLANGDRLILRDPGTEGALTGAVVVDTAPAALTRRGDAARRGAEVEASDQVTLADEVRRRGHLSRADATLLLGHDPGPPSREHFSPVESARRGHRVNDVVGVGDYFATRERVAAWTRAVLAVVDRRAAGDPLDPLVPMAAARDAAGVPDLVVLEQLCDAAGLQVERGRVCRPGTQPSLGPAQAGLDHLLARLTEDPFAAPEAPDLASAGLGPRELAAAEALGRLVRLPDDIVLLPTGPAQAMRILAALAQPFTTSQARQALGTTRRVAIPLLEHLDQRGWTRRLDAGHREVVR